MKRLMTRLSKIRISAGSGLLVALVLLVGGVFLVPTGRSSPGTDPSTEPVPDLDFTDPAKSMVVKLIFNSRTDVDFQAAEVSMERAHANLGDPPLLFLRLLDDEGAFMQQLNAWHPLWVFQEGAGGEEHKIELPSTTGRHVIPFDPDLGTMRVIDAANNNQVIEVDLKPAIRDFCETNPSDPDCDIADLAVQSVGAISVPPLFLVGQSQTVTIRAVTTNLGPDAPMDAVLTGSASATAGLSVAPAEVTQLQTALGLNELRAFDRSYTLECTAPGAQTATFTYEIEPRKAAVSDPDHSNDRRTFDLRVDCAVPVTMNIKPGGDPNSINRRGKSDIPVAALTTAAGEYGNPLAFDATTIDPLSARFGPPSLVIGGGGATETHNTGHIQDAFELDERTKDGDLDMSFHFAPSAAGFSLSDTEGCLRGSLVAAAGGYTFFGCGAVRIVR